MKIYAAVGATLLACGALAQVIRVSGYKGEGVEQLYNQYYSTSSEITISGKITGKVKGAPSNGMAESMSILVRNSKGKVYSVDLGPTWYVGQQNEKLSVGDKVKVIGSSLRFGKGEDVVLARQVIRGHETMALRNHVGTPYWVAYKPKPPTSPDTDESVAGTIVGTKEVNAYNEREMALQLQTPNGLINVAMAPDWFLRDQGLGFRVGDDITIYTAPGAVQFGTNIILANGYWNYGGSAVVLRPGGYPIWSP